MLLNCGLSGLESGFMVFFISFSFVCMFKSMQHFRVTRYQQQALISENNFLDFGRLFV